MQKNILLIGGGISILVIIVIVVVVVSKKQVNTSKPLPTNLPSNLPSRVSVPTGPPNTDLKYAQSTDKSPDVGPPIPKASSENIVTTTKSAGIASSNLNQSTNKAVEQSTTVGTNLDLLSSQVNTLFSRVTGSSLSPSPSPSPSPGPASSGITSALLAAQQAAEALAAKKATEALDAQKAVQALAAKNQADALILATQKAAEEKLAKENLEKALAGQQAATPALQAAAQALVKQQQAAQELATQKAAQALAAQQQAAQALAAQQAATEALARQQAIDALARQQSVALAAEQARVKEQVAAQTQAKQKAAQELIDAQQAATKQAAAEKQAAQQAAAQTAAAEKLAAENLAKAQAAQQAATQAQQAAAQELVRQQLAAQQLAAQQAAQAQAAQKAAAEALVKQQAAEAEQSRKLAQEALAREQAAAEAMALEALAIKTSVDTLIAQYRLLEELVKQSKINSIKATYAMLNQIMAEQTFKRDTAKRTKDSFDALIRYYNTVVDFIQQNCSGTDSVVYKTINESYNTIKNRILAVRTLPQILKDVDSLLNREKLASTGYGDFRPGVSIQPGFKQLSSQIPQFINFPYDSPTWGLQQRTSMEDQEKRIRPMINTYYSMKDEARTILGNIKRISTDMYDAKTLYQKDLLIIQNYIIRLNGSINVLPPPNLTLPYVTGSSVTDTSGSLNEAIINTINIKNNNTDIATYLSTMRGVDTTVTSLANSLLAEKPVDINSASIDLNSVYSALQGLNSSPALINEVDSISKQMSPQLPDTYQKVKLNVLSTNVTDIILKYTAYVKDLFNTGGVYNIQDAITLLEANYSKIEAICNTIINDTTLITKRWEVQPVDPATIDPTKITVMGQPIKLNLGF